MIIAIVILSLVCIGLLAYLLLMKNQIRGITKELKSNRQESYNKQIRVQLLDADLTELTKECNYNLDYQTDLKRRNQQQEATVKQGISDIAHDLRTPLTVVKGNLQMIEQVGELNERGHKYLEICEAKTEELKTMMDEFFELALLESDDSPVEVNVINLTNVLLEFILQQEILIREHQLEPEIFLPEKTVFVEGNGQLLERIFGNLLGNIFKYGKERFTVRLMEEGETCIVEFSNAIAGHPTIDVEHLFDRSYMADASRSKTGTGLGLYIVKLLAQKQGADVSARMEADELVIRLQCKCINQDNRKEK